MQVTSSSLLIYVLSHRDRRKAFFLRFFPSLCFAPSFGDYKMIQRIKQFLSCGKQTPHPSETLNLPSSKHEDIRNVMRDGTE